MKIIKNVGIILVLLIVLSPTAFAYLDAGTGSIIIQALIAGIVGSLFAIKLFWNKIKNLFSKIFKKK